ncbi:MAG TPA: toprim domain-containing protein [Streptosporangiaceae bacterium]|nr:toprim domain-containing protein [Streptosporangiaceae bacterium]
MWNLAAVAASDEVIVTESLIDALTFWCAGFRHVTACYGAGGFTPDHERAFERLGVRRVLIAFDRDDAGDKAAKALAGELAAKGIECFRVEFPAGADANDVAVGSKSPAEALGRAIRSASWMGTGPGPARRGNAPLPEPAAPEPRPEPALVSAAVPAPAGPPVDPAGAGTPAPAAAGADEPAVSGGEASWRFGERAWRVRGLDRAASFESLRVNVMVPAPDGRGEPRFHVDTVDLYSARARAGFVAAAAAELAAGPEVIKRDLGRVLLGCERLADQAVTAAQAPQQGPPPMTPERRERALALLRDPGLAERITADFARAGMAGEAANCLVGYLAAVSRKLPRPLAVIVQSTSAAGKSALMDAVLGFVPGEDRVRFSAMTGQSLFYMGEADLAHKVLAVAEEEGAERASYALKLLQSDGELSIASTGKDPATGRLVTHTYTVTGPAAIFLTTTATDVDEELLNRCLVLTVDEGREQTRAIHDRQRAAQTLDGLLAGAEAESVRRLHQDAQRLIEPLAVVNPDARSLRFADGTVRARRDHMKYLTLIAAVTLLHQHQRPVKTASRGEAVIRYVETTPADIALADKLAARILAHSLDELPPGTRRLLDAIAGYVAARSRAEGTDPGLIRFTRRQLREALPLGDSQLKVHLARLADYELVIARRTGSGGFCYELACLYQTVAIRRRGADHAPLLHATEMMLRDGRPFPAAYLARELDELPSGADLVEMVPGHQEGPGGLIFEVEPQACESWVGRARPSAMNARGAVSGLVPTPNPDNLCVLVRGTAYLVDVTDHSYRPVAVSAPVVAAVPVAVPGVLLLATPWHVIGVGPDGVVWRTERLAIDGLRLDEADESRLIGVADPESAEAREFVIDLRSGTHEGGAMFGS